MLPRNLAGVLWLCGVLVCAAGEDGYELHEWGVIQVPRNAAWANLDMKAEWAGMPKAFYGTLPGRTLPYRGEVAKPVIYFHASRAMKLELRIRFAQGLPTIWWPAAEQPANGVGPNAKDTLVFRPHLIERDKSEVHGPAGRHPRKLEVPEGHWVRTVRDVKAAEVFCSAGWSNAGEFWDTEHFIYYDGLMKPPSAPKVAREENGIVLETDSDHDWLDMLALERGESGLAVSDWIERIEAGKRSTRIPLKAPMGRRGEGPVLDRLREELSTRLVKAGLHADEASALVKVWDEGFFAQGGLTVLYRIPQETYEKWLPLEAKPAPRRTVRVGLVLHRRLEPELDVKVEALIKDLGNEAFDTRDAARKSLLKFGGAAFPLLERHSQDADAEIARACHAILESLDARPLLEEPKKE